MNPSTPILPVHHQLPEFTQTHMHQVGDAIQPSHPLSSPSPSAPNPSQHQGLFQSVNSCLFSCIQFICHPMDYSLPGSPVHEISQVRILEWVAILFSRGSSWPRDRTHISCIADRFFTAEPPGKPLSYSTSGQILFTLLQQYLLHLHPLFPFYF